MTESFLNYITSVSIDEQVLPIETEEERRKREDEEELQRQLEELGVIESEEEPVVEEPPPVVEEEEIVATPTTEEEVPVERESKLIPADPPEQIAPSVKRSFIDFITQDTDPELAGEDPDFVPEAGEPSWERKIAYGMKQEPWLLSNIFRLGSARFKSWAEGRDYHEVAREIEAARQEEILELFPEFRGREEDAEVIVGRVMAGIADPGYWLLPWARIAKAGKAAYATAGAGIASADIALREEALYGEVSPMSIAIAAPLGGATTYIAASFAARARAAVDEVVEVTDETGKVVNKKIKIDKQPEQPKINKATANEALEDSLADSLPHYQNLVDASAEAGPRHTLVTVIQKRLSDLKQELRNLEKPKTGKAEVLGSRKALYLQHEAVDAELELAKASERTRISRKVPSLPTKTLFKNIEVTKGTKVLHVGAGDIKNPDVKFLNDKFGSKNVIHYDPYGPFAKAEAKLGKGDFDIVYSPYVLNTLPPSIRKQAVIDAATSVKTGGSVFFAVRGTDVTKKGQLFADGIVTARGTFQKGYKSADDLIDDLKVLPLFSEFNIIKDTAASGMVIVEAKIANAANKIADPLALTPAKWSMSLGSKGRWTPAGVGSQIGSKIYVHSKYAKDVIRELDKADGGTLWAKQYTEVKKLAKTAKFGEHNTLVFDKKLKTVRLNNSPNFDKVSEPTVGKYFTLNREGKINQGSSNAIWHHKWSFVKDDYKGFNVNTSVLESVAWQRLYRDKFGKGRADIGSRANFEAKIPPDEYAKELAWVQKVYRATKKDQKVLDDQVTRLKLNAERKKLNADKLKAQKEIKEIESRIPEDLGSIAEISIREAFKKGVLTPEFASWVTYNTVKPIIGAGAGAAFGMVTAEDQENPDRWIAGWTLAGATGGVLWKKINAATYLKPKDKQKILDAVEGTTKNQVRRAYLNKAREVLSGSHAQKLIASHPILQRFAAKMFNLQGGGIKTGVVLEDSVEDMASQVTNLWRRELALVTARVDDDTLLAAGRIVQERNMPTGAKFSFLQRGDKSNVEANKVARELEELRERFGKYVESTGIKFEKEEAYGLTQILKDTADQDVLRNILIDAFKVQRLNDIKFNRLVTLPDGRKVNAGKFKPLDDAKAEEQARKYINGFTGRERGSIWAADVNATNIKNLSKGGRLFAGSKEAEPDVLISAARHFEHERVLRDQEARAMIANFLENDPRKTFEALFANTVRISEFSRRFGSKGEGIRNTIRELHTEFAKYGDDAVHTKMLDHELKKLKDSVDAYFGRFGADKVRGDSDNWRTTYSVLQAVLSTTTLTKVALPSFGDILQTIQNSGFRATYNSAINRSKKLAESGELARPSKTLANNETYGDLKFFDRVWGNKRYDATLHTELSAWMLDASKAGSGLGGKIERFSAEYQRRFFEFVQLGRITRFARDLAYDAGAYRAFDLGEVISKTKGKVSNRLTRELQGLGMNKQAALYLNKFKTMDDAYADAMGKRIIDRAGWKAAERDAIIPTIANRRIFAQSNYPPIRFLGSFLSWAQAKSSQTNALVSRMENGEAVLAVRMMAATVLYGGVRAAQLQMSSSKEYAEEAWNWDYLLDKKNIGDTMIFSAQFLPWYLDKIANASRGDYGDTSVAEGVAPVLRLIDDFWDSIQGIAIEGEYEKGLINLGEASIPFFKDLSRGLEWEERLKEQEKKEKKRKKRKIYIEGGQVSEDYPVPNAPPVPMERKDRMGDQSYAVQASAEPINPFTGEPYTELYYKGGKVRRRIVGITDNGKYYLTNYGEGSIPIKDAPKSLVKEFRERIV